MFWEANEGEARFKHSYDGKANRYVSELGKPDSSRMDYIFGIKSLQKGAIKLMQLLPVSCDMLDADVENPCSDHWPISVTLRPA
jgi:hypothetical protein